MSISFTIQSLLDSRGYIRAADIVCDPLHPNKPHLLPISRTTLWRWIRQKRFPRPLKLSPGVTAWKASDVLAWHQAAQADGDN
jgi:predicted DNA-binding transcriptional regulator AlpA